MRSVRPFMLTAGCALLVSCGGAEQSLAPVVLSRLSTIAGGGQTVNAGTALAQAIVIRASAADGTPVTGINLVWSPDAGSVDSVTSTNASGEARARWTVGTMSGMHRLIVSTSGVGSLSDTVIATVLPGPAASIATASGNTQIGTVGTELPLPIQARVADSFGNAVPNVAVTWTLDRTAGSLPSAVSITDSLGIASVRWTMPPRSGSYTLKAAAGAAVVAFTASAHADIAAALLVIGRDTLSGPFGAMLLRPLSARVVDRFGNPVPGARVTVSGAPASAATLTADTGGVVSVRVSTPNTIGTSYTVDLSSDSASRSFTVIARATPFARLFPGSGRACALSPEGYAYCWGDNTNFAVGVGDNNPTRYFARPTAVLSDQVFTTLSAGAQGTCGIATDARLWCWGAWFNGSYIQQTTPGLPFLVAGSLRFSSVSVGESHTCAIATDGTVYCWGSNYDGESGASFFGSYAQTMTAVTGAPPLVAVAAGDNFTCGVGADAAAYCWGTNAHWQLGDSVSTSLCVYGTNGPCSQFPQKIRSTEHFTAVTTGQWSACGLTSDGRAVCWGGNEAGEDGTGTQALQILPSAVASSDRYDGISMADGLTCAQTQGGQAECWGQDLQEFGLAWHSCPVIQNPSSGFTSCYPAPTAISPFTVFSSFSSGRQFACGIDAHGVALCWGYNFDGEIGDGTGYNRTSPTKVLGQP